MYLEFIKMATRFMSIQSIQFKSVIQVPFRSQGKFSKSYHLSILLSSLVEQKIEDKNDSKNSVIIIIYK